MKSVFNVDFQDGGLASTFPNSVQIQLTVEESVHHTNQVFETRWWRLFQFDGIHKFVRELISSRNTFTFNLIQTELTFISTFNPGSEIIVKCTD